MRFRKKFGEGVSGVLCPPFNSCTDSARHVTADGTDEHTGRASNCLGGGFPHVGSGDDEDDDSEYDGDEDD
jgi:hypothetical protein